VDPATYIHRTAR